MNPKMYNCLLVLICWLPARAFCVEYVALTGNFYRHEGAIRRALDNPQVSFKQKRQILYHLANTLDFDDPRKAIVAEAMENPDENVARYAQHQLYVFSPYKIREHLKSANASVRRAALSIAWKFTTWPDVIELVAEVALYDSDIEFKTLALRTCAWQRPRSEAAKQTLESIAAGEYSYRQPELESFATESLIKKEFHNPTILELLSSEDPFEVLEGVNSLRGESFKTTFGKLYRNSPLRNRLLELTDHPHPDVRSAVVNRLMGNGLRALIEIFDHSESIEARRQAASSYLSDKYDRKQRGDTVKVAAMKIGFSEISRLFDNTSEIETLALLKGVPETGYINLNGLLRLAEVYLKFSYSEDIKQAIVDLIQDYDEDLVGDVVREYRDVSGGSPEYKKKLVAATEILIASVLKRNRELIAKLDLVVEENHVQPKKLSLTVEEFERPPGDMEKSCGLLKA